MVAQQTCSATDRKKNGDCGASVAVSACCGTVAVATYRCAVTASGYGCTVAAAGYGCTVVNAAYRWTITVDACCGILGAQSDVVTSSYHSPADSMMR
jgi:hypothetical protein